MVSEEHLKNKLSTLKKEYDEHRKLINGLRNKRLYNTDVKTVFQLNSEIKEEENKSDELAHEIYILENKIYSNQKSNQSVYDDEFSGGSQEKFLIWASIDGFKHQIEAEGYEGESTAEKICTSLRKLREAHNKDTRIPPEIKDSDRKIYRKSKYGEQILLKDDDPIFPDDRLETRPDAVKG
ncbi:MAG: hypothetical protein KME64_39035 [Scytonematopsis contorta HA4267-MV1]|jgi:hypothetical protein|nr:hypothetical protein [Scytonematopsis contorta HA4267-MV1]